MGIPRRFVSGESAAFEPCAGEVRVKLLASNINPSDFGMVAGSYGALRDLPAVAARGIGEIEAIGKGLMA